MEYFVNRLTTVADCDLLLSLAAKEKDDLTFRKLSLERQQANYAENAVEIDTELQAATAELTALDTIIAALQEGELKDDNITRQKRLQLKVFLLNDKKGSYGSVALLEKQFDVAKVITNLEEADAYIGALQARKAQLTH
jgi:hypothetical protein